MVVMCGVVVVGGKVILVWECVYVDGLIIYVIMCF